MSIAQDITFVNELQDRFLEKRSKEKKKLLGQYFCNSEISEYMSTLLVRPNSSDIRILDAGAGSGILTVSTSLRCLELGCKSVHAVLYEIDKGTAELLHDVLESHRNSFQDAGGKFTYEIRIEDFILKRPDIFKGDEKFDIAVINPPYFKYNVKSSPYSGVVSDLFPGDPNVYASFVAIVLNCLRDRGQLVSITPRSFTNGLYFKGFRNFLLTRSSLESIHVFRLRNRLFHTKSQSVLQENVICKFVRGKRQGNVSIHSSECAANLNAIETNVYDSTTIIDGSNSHNIIRIPETFFDGHTLKRADSLLSSFEEAGYFVSTGPVVEHRSQEFVCPVQTESPAVPLYRPHNVVPMIAGWSGNHAKDIRFQLAFGYEKHTVKNKNYVLLKRLTSKDERRRLVAAVYLREAQKEDIAAFGNKINYIGVVNGDLSRREAIGIAAVFNSSFMDRYFRCISGNTQVNATEVRIMRFPTRDQVMEIGKAADELIAGGQESLDSIVNLVLNVS